MLPVVKKIKFLKIFEGILSKYYARFLNAWFLKVLKNNSVKF